MTGRPAAPPGPGPGSAAVRDARARLDELVVQAAAQAASSEEEDGTGKKAKPVRNVTDPDSRLMPVRGGGLKQGCDCQDVAADDRLMLGGFVSASAAGTVHAARL